MTLDTLIMLAGACVAVLPFLGFPASWDTALLFILGAAIIGLGIAVRRRKSSHESIEERRDAFQDIGPRNEHEAF